jgi:hypothetical protein
MLFAQGIERGRLSTQDDTPQPLTKRSDGTVTGCRRRFVSLPGDISRRLRRSIRSHAVSGKNVGRLR